MANWAEENIIFYSDLFKQYKTLVPTILLLLEYIFIKDDWKK